MASVPMSTRSDTPRAATDACLATYTAEHGTAQSMCCFELQSGVHYLITCSAAGQADMQEWSVMMFSVSNHATTQPFCAV